MQAKQRIYVAWQHFDNNNNKNNNYNEKVFRCQAVDKAAKND